MQMLQEQQVKHVNDLISDPSSDNEHCSAARKNLATSSSVQPEFSRARSNLATSSSVQPEFSSWPPCDAADDAGAAQVTLASVAQLSTATKLLGDLCDITRVPDPRLLSIREQQISLLAAWTAALEQHYSC